MREILFRAKRIDNGNWVEGDLRQDRDLKTDYISGWDYYATEGGLEREPFEYEIEPETLCQYTGLKDKNSKRIWENDIVSCEHKKYPYDDSVVFPLLPDPIKYKRKYAVKFINTGSNYGYILRNKSIHFMLTGNVVYNHKIEVVGNVFDDKYLLDEKEGLNEVAKRI